jgi:hypothetical protein
VKDKYSKTVAYILGAGFSYGTGHVAYAGAGRVEMPLQNTLLQILSIYNHRHMHRIDDVAKEIRKYFNPKGYRTTRKNGSKRHADLFGLSVEEIVTFFDELVTTHHPDEDKIREISKKLLELTTELISHLSRKGKPGQNIYLKKFVKEHIKQTDLIITFNWDTILDRVLENNSKETNWNRAWGYGKTIRNDFAFGSQKHQRIPNKYPKLLKLHGSVNWMATHTEGEQDLSISKFWGIKEDYENVVMMPPKMIKKEIWRQDKTVQSTVQPDDIRHGNEAIGDLYPDLWKEAEDRLSDCKKIVFIGYSFPPADYAVTNMLRRALSKIKVSTQKSPTICIVDPRASDLAKRFEDSFKLEVPIHNRFLSLQSYLNNPRL